MGVADQGRWHGTRRYRAAPRAVLGAGLILILLVPGTAYATTPTTTPSIGPPSIGPSSIGLSIGPPSIGPSSIGPSSTTRPTATTTPAPTTTTTTSPAQLENAAIRVRQQHVVTANHLLPLDLAQGAVSEYTADTQSDTQAVATDQGTQTAAAAALTAATTRLNGDRRTVTADTASLFRTEQALSLDRTRLAAIAMGMYTGALTNPQPANVQLLEEEQDRIIDTAEVEVVAGDVDSHLHGDLAAARTATTRRDRAAAVVDTDDRTRAADQVQAFQAAARTADAQAVLVSDDRRLAQADKSLDAAESSLTAALASITGPSGAQPGKLSLRGGSALTSQQLVAWFTAQGYVDLTAAPIEDLAAWYIQSGAQEGVRGDVAFAQAVLETGGFSSPDAVDLSNFAGIGHCDTCAVGWGFPSPHLGVLGHVQLLRIFADKGPGPPHAPPPVLPALTPAAVGVAGCCATVESLTGVWATDPTYGQQILSIYGSMLDFALAPQ